MLIIDIIPYRFPTIRYVIYVYINVIRSLCARNVILYDSTGKSIKRRTESQVYPILQLTRIQRCQLRETEDTMRSGSNGRLHLHGARNVPC